jgi:hypothetical protein
MDVMNEEEEPKVQIEISIGDLWLLTDTVMQQGGYFTHEERIRLDNLERKLGAKLKEETAQYLLT